MGQKKFDTNINKRREISEKNFSFQIKNTGDVKTTIFMNFLCRKVYWNSCESAFKSFCVGFWLALIGFVPFYTVPFYTPPSVLVFDILITCITAAASAEFFIANSASSETSVKTFFIKMCSTRQMLFKAFCIMKFGRVTIFMISSSTSGTIKSWINFKDRTSPCESQNLTIFYLDRQFLVEDCFFLLYPTYFHI